MNPTVSTESVFGSIARADSRAHSICPPDELAHDPAGAVTFIVPRNRRALVRAGVAPACGYARSPRSSAFDAAITLAGVGGTQRPYPLVGVIGGRPERPFHGLRGDGAVEAVAHQKRVGALSALARVGDPGERRCLAGQ